MKTLKKIHLGTQLSHTQMGGLVGGSDINKADYCSCSGSTNSNWLCKDNNNTAYGCKCTGNGENTNGGLGCT